MKESAALGVRRSGGGESQLVALHGFTQTGAMYEEMAALLDTEVVAQDLPGHGLSSGVPASFDGAVAGVAEVMAGLDRPLPLLGYSQGGRVALGVALEHPDLVSQLILISTSPGIEADEARTARRQSDDALATRLAAIGLPGFLDEWLAKPMFQGLRKRGRVWETHDRTLRLENHAAGLAAALRGMGQGAQPYLGERLAEIALPVLVMAGALDQLYVTLSERMRDSLPIAELEVIPAAGHAVIGEEPEIVADLVRRFVADGY
jgi:2-succinyl-6-hydroxy-2,4-cyclohexadiene-1-carboxylate synthase